MKSKSSMEIMVLYSKTYAVGSMMRVDGDVVGSFEELVLRR